MTERYDALVIGSGPAGGLVARTLNTAGMSVAVIENYGFGGTCPLRGCEPKKVLVEAANAVTRVKDMQGIGIKGLAEVDWPELITFERSLVDPVSDRVEASFDHSGITTYFGAARFTSDQEIEVDEEHLTGTFIIVAAGAIPRPIDIPGKEYVSTSDDFLAMPELPRRILFMGGGFISFELGNVAARAGAEVTILEVAERPLTPFDPDLVGLVVDHLKDVGLNIQLNCPVQSVEKSDRELVVHAGKNGEMTYKTDMIVHGAGRVPAVAGLDLEKAGVEYSNRGITVNDYMQSVSNPGVYAVGDISATTHPLTPVASMEAAVAAHNIIHGNQKKAVHFGLPSTVFTNPPLSAIGMREEDAQKAGLKFKTIFKNTSDWSEHKRIGLKTGGIKILVDEAKDRLLGAHILGHRSEEMINVLALAMQHDLPLSRVMETVWSYPSFIYNLRYVLR